MVSKFTACVAASFALAVSHAESAAPPAMAITPPAGTTTASSAAAAAAAATAANNAAAVAARSTAGVAAGPVKGTPASSGAADARSAAQPASATSAPAAAPFAAGQPAGGVAGTPATYNLPMGAVTIRTLAQAQARELEADARRRLGVALGGTTSAAPAPSQSAASTPGDAITTSKVMRLRVPAEEKPSPLPYRLVGVVGRLGAEVAEVREPSGRVSVVRAGQRLGNWTVLAVTPSRIELSWNGRVSKKSPAKPNQSVSVGGTFL